MSVASSITPAGGISTLPGAPRRSLSFADLVDGYMAAYTGRDHTRGHYLAQWREQLGAGEAAALDADQVADVLDYFARTPAHRYLGRDPATGAPRYRLLGLRKPSTLNRYKSALSAVFTWARRRRLMPRGWVNPCREIPALPENNERIRFLATAERERLLAVAKTSTCARFFLLVLMALVTGARRGELLGLRWRDLDLEAGTAMLHHTKNGRPRVLPLTPAVLAELRRLGRNDPEALLFPGRARHGRPSQPMDIDHAWGRALADARIENFRFHDLRHSCASYLAQSGASLLEIADVLGHQSLDVTRRYAHLTIDTKARLVNRVLGNIGGSYG